MTLRIHLAAAATLCALESFFIGLPVLSLVAGGASVFGVLVGSMVQLVRGKRPSARILLVPLLYFGAMVATTLGISAQNGLAERRAETVIAALHAYRFQHSTYPDTLEALVPDQLPAVPRAKLLTGSKGEFHYVRRPAEGTTTLSYVVISPLERRVYDFGTGEWTFED